MAAVCLAACGGRADILRNPPLRDWRCNATMLQFALRSRVCVSVWYGVNRWKRGPHQGCSPGVREGCTMVSLPPWCIAARGGRITCHTAARPTQRRVGHACSGESVYPDYCWINGVAISNTSAGVSGALKASGKGFPAFNSAR